MKWPVRYAPEVRERADRMLLELQGEYESEWVAMNSIASKIGRTAETLGKWVRQAERDMGVGGGMTSSYRDRFKERERQNRELKRANAIQRKASAHFVQAGSATGSYPASTEVMVSFIDNHRAEYGVEPICNTLRIAHLPSTSIRREKSIQSDCCSELSEKKYPVH